MIVYRITNRANGKIYIGQISADKTLSKRWREHQLYPANRHLSGAIRKYGVENFKTELLYTAKSLEELNAMETFFIILHQSHKPENGYNMTLGGDGLLGLRHSKQTRQKISEAHLAIRDEDSARRKAEWQMPDRREVARQRKIGSIQSEEIRRKISKANSGRQFNLKQIDNMRKAWTLERRAIQAIRMKEMRKGAATAV
jgi:group I intron endonuclease